MMLLSILTALALQAVPADTPNLALDSATIASAYVDPGARELVEQARARRRTVNRSIQGYETIVRERFSAGVRAAWVERLLYRRETATRIHWSREGPTRMEVLGAREVAPIAESGVQVPEDLDGLMSDLAFDPGEGERWLGWSDSSFIRHPLARGSEADYRFRSGDTTAIRLPDGRTVRLIELEVLPRRESPFIIRGSLWLDAHSHAVARVGFRLADDVNTGTWDLSFETAVERDSTGTHTTNSISFVPASERERRQLRRNMQRDTAADDPGAASNAPAPGASAEDRPTAVEDSAAAEEEGGVGILQRTAIGLALAMVPDIRARLRHVAIDYGLWEGRWWLPRLLVIEGVVEVAGLEAPLRYERRYGAYRVAADSTPAPAPSLAAAVSDSVAEPHEIIVSVPDDTTSLLTSEYLSPSVFATDAWLVDQTDVEALLGDLAELTELDVSARAPWHLAWSDIDWDPLIRYNRVEELSLGLRAEFDSGPFEVAAAARLGTGDIEPRGSLSLVGRSAGARYELTGYRRLETMDPRGKAFSNVASASALLFGYDEPDYYDVLGLSLGGRPLPSASQWYEWRLYAQRESAVRKQTDFSVPHLFDGGKQFRPNPAAAEAVQYGAELALRRWWGRDPDGLRWGGELQLGAATGDFTYARPSVTLRTTFPLPGSLVGALEAGAGAVWGNAGLQHLRRVGGTPSVRGYHGSALVGESSWRLRAEIATRVPLARLILFSDAGWAGPFETFAEADPLVSAGLGVSFLDGLIRIDLARAMIAPTGWRVAVYVDGPL